jgi:hypothetical protein
MSAVAEAMLTNSIRIFPAAALASISPASAVQKQEGASRQGNATTEVNDVT